jgi:hypothetical protein
MSIAKALTAGALARTAAIGAVRTSNISLPTALFTKSEAAWLADFGIVATVRAGT